MTYINMHIGRIRPLTKRKAGGRIGETALPFGRLPEKDAAAAIQAIKKGLPYRIFEHLRASLDVTEAKLAGVAGIKLRTLARRKIEGRFTPEESDRIHRLAALWEKTVAFFKSEERAAAWLKAPQYHFRDIAPLDFADTEVGTREVHRLLGRIENGVF
jgi:putative toxin-antitoxin system antitoxin component (TIGR02293 family)